MRSSPFSSLVICVRQQDDNSRTLWTEFDKKISMSMTYEPARQTEREIEN